MWPSAAWEGFEIARFTAWGHRWVCRGPMSRWGGLQIRECETCRLSLKTWHGRSRSRSFRSWCWSTLVYSYRLVCKSWVEVPRTWQPRHSLHHPLEKMMTLTRRWRFGFGNEMGSLYSAYGFRSSWRRMIPSSFKLATHPWDAPMVTIVSKQSLYTNSARHLLLKMNDA